MTRRSIGGVLLAAGLVVSLPPAPVQTAPQSPDATTVSAAPVSAAPGTRAVLPFSLAAPEGTSVGKLEFSLTYPKESLTFDKAEPSGLVQGIGAKIETVVDNGPDAKTSILRTTITAPAEGGTRQALPSGPLVYVAFMVDKAAKPETSIELIHAATASRADDETKPIAPIVAAKVKLDVARPPVPACFFYMH